MCLVKKMAIYTPYSYAIIGDDNTSKLTGGFNSIGASKDQLVCVEEPDFNYTPYDLFCLRTKLLMAVPDILGYSIDIQLPSAEKDNRMFVVVAITLGQEEVEISTSNRDKIRLLVEEYTSSDPKSCLLFSWKASTRLDDGTPIDSSWVRSMLPYISIPGQYFPSVGNNGIYLNLKDVIDYVEVYNSLNMSIRDQIIVMHQNSYMTKMGHIAENWGLISLDEDKTLFRATWVDLRFAKSTINFLLSRISGERRIRMPIRNSWVLRHNIYVSLFGKFKEISFDSTNVLVSVDSLSEARQAASIIEYVQATSSGDVTITVVEDTSVGDEPANIESVLGVYGKEMSREANNTSGTLDVSKTSNSSNVSKISGRSRADSVDINGRRNNSIGEELVEYRYNNHWIKSVRHILESAW